MKRKGIDEEDQIGKLCTTNKDMVHEHGVHERAPTEQLPANTKRRELSHITYSTRLLLSSSLSLQNVVAVLRDAVSGLIEVARTPLEHTSASLIKTRRKGHQRLANTQVNPLPLSYILICCCVVKNLKCLHKLILFILICLKKFRCWLKRVAPEHGASTRCEWLLLPEIVLAFVLSSNPPTSHALVTMYKAMYTLLLSFFFLSKFKIHFIYINVDANDRLRHLPLQVTYNGFKELACPTHLVMELQMAGAEVSSELQTLVEQAVKDIKKGKAEKRAMRLNCDELALQLDDTSVRLPCFQTTACAPRFSHTRFPRVLLPQVVLSSLMECSAYNNLRLFPGIL